MSLVKSIAGLFRMNDEAWRRHANPWSVYTRFAAIPLMVFAAWSRLWIGWWAVVPVGPVIIWLLVNPRVFPPVLANHGWAAKGIYGERLWLESTGGDIPKEYRIVLRRLTATGAIGGAILLWGIIQLAVWPTVFGATVLILAQLWRIDRMGLLYEQSTRDKASQELGAEIG